MLHCSECGKVLPRDDYSKLYEIKETKFFEEIQDDINLDGIVKGKENDILLQIDYTCKECIGDIETDLMEVINLENSKESVRKQ